MLSMLNFFAYLHRSLLCTLKNSDGNGAERDNGEAGSFGYLREKNELNVERGTFHPCFTCRFLWSLCLFVFGVLVFVVVAWFVGFAVCFGTNGINHLVPISGLDGASFRESYTGLLRP